MKSHTVSNIIGISLIGLLTCSCSIFSSSDTNKTIVVTNDRESLHPEKISSFYSPEELAQGILKGDWAIEKVYGKTAVGETAPYLKFDTDKKMIYGNNGCNYFNANYTYSQKDSTLSFSDPISTLKACGMSGITDYEINNALSQTKKYTWDTSDHQYYLHFFSQAGVEVMTLMHQNFNFLNGTWLVESINDRVINQKGFMKEPDMRLVIDIDEGKVHGNTGCNILNGIVRTDMDTPNCISFEQLVTTRRACPDSQNESDMLVALEEVYTARPLTKDRVDLINNQGNVVMRLSRVSGK